MTCKKALFKPFYCSNLEGVTNGPGGNRTHVYGSGDRYSTIELQTLAPEQPDKGFKSCVD